MQKWRVTVLRGGPSSEREVSLVGGKAVADAVRSRGHTVVEADIVPDNLDALDLPADIIFPILHGRFGEDGQLQAIMEQRGLCFVGSGAEASRMAMDKDVAKRQWRQAGLPTVPWSIVTHQSLKQALPSVMAPPCVVKPVDEGSSIGVRFCDTPESLSLALTQVVAEFGRVLVEKQLHGPEITVGILGLDPLPVIQIRPATQFYDYQAKYQRGDTAYLFAPEIDAATYRLCQELALQAFQVLGCRDFARVDMIVDRQSSPQLLEINTIPGFTSHSLLPMAASRAGISFDELVETLLRLAWTRHK